MMKRFLAVLLVCCLAFSMFACSSSSKTTEETKDKPTDSATVVSKDTSKVAPANDKPLILAWLGTGQDKVSLDKNLKVYTDKTGVKVESLFIPGTWAEYFTKMQTMIAGGDTIDNAFIAVEGFRMFVDLGLAAPLSKYAADGGSEIKAVIDDISPNIMKSVYVDNELYAAPTEWNNGVMHFNTKRLEEAGLSIPSENWTKEEFLDYCKKLTKEVNGKKQYAIAITDHYMVAESWLYTNGAAYMTDDFKKSTINSPESIEIFQLWQDLIYKYKYAPIPEKNVDIIQQLIDGTVAMGSWGRWPSMQYLANDFKDVAVQYLPNFKKKATAFGVGGIAVMKQSKRFEEAAKLAFWMATPEFGTNFFSAGAIPASRTIANDVIPKLGFPKNFELFYGSSEIAVVTHSPIQYPECESIVLRAMSDILTNQKDVKTTLDAAAAEMDAVLSAN